MGRIRLRNLFVPLLAAMAVPPLAAAATFPVNTGGDLRDAAIDGVCEATAGIGDCTLRAAIAEANATPAPDVIQLAGTRYTLTITGAGEDAGATGDLDVTGPLTIQGAGRSNTVLSGQGLGDRVLDVGGHGVLRLNDVGIRDGRAADGGNVRVRKGGRLTVLRGDVLFGDAKTGGGVSVDGTATLQRTTVMHNAASRGGGIANRGSLSLDGAEIAENIATQGGGLDTSGAVLIRGSAVAHNRATAGGGILQTRGLPRTVAKVVVDGLEVQRTTIAHNASRTSAAVVVKAGGVAVSDVTIARNTRATPGTGGIEASGPFPSRNSLFAVNAGANCSPKAATQGGNLSDDKSCVTANAALSDRVAKAQLGELVRSVGPTPAMELLPGSPAVDAGLGCQARDQRGFARPGGPRCDTGAYEIHPPDFTATPAGDDVDVNPGDGTCASAGGVCTLRAAVQEANALAGPQAVRLRGRAFGLSIAGANEDGAATGDLDVTEDLAIEAPSGAAASLDGAGLGDRLFDVDPGGAGDVELALTRLDLRNATGPGIGGALRIGAVLAPPSYALVRSAALEGNVAVVQPAFGFPVSIGGAVDASSSDVGLIDARLTRNRAVDFGGAVSVDGHALLRRTAIAGNQAVGVTGPVDAGGGGMFVGTNALVDADQAVVADNVAGSFAANLTGSGGGIFSRGAVFATGLRLERNTASVNGGGIHLPEARLDLDASRITDNRAEVRTGGIHMVLGAKVRLRRSVVARNAGGTFGAGGVGGAGVLTATDSTFSGDTTLGVGAREIAAAATLTQVTIVNTGPAVGGGPAVSFGNSIVDAGANACVVPAASRGGNMDAGASCGFAAAADVGGISAALGPLMDNGGDTLTHALPPGSPAVASALPALCTPEDQRGAPRPVTCDRGAFEAP